MAGLSFHELVKCLRKLGFEGPIKVGGKHPWAMRREGHTYKIPSDHPTDLGSPLLSRLRKQLNIPKEDCRIA